MMDLHRHDDPMAHIMAWLWRDVDPQAVQTSNESVHVVSPEASLGQQQRSLDPAATLAAVSRIQLQILARADRALALLPSLAGRD
ncbi:TPA: hypothetical protein ACH3X1_006538 [Trebouxia sp. C0004]